MYKVSYNIRTPSLSSLGCLVQLKDRNSRRYRWADVVILVLSAYCAIYLGVITLTGAVWSLVTPEFILVVIPLFSGGILASVSIILTHSTVQFFQTRRIYDLVILLMALDLIMLVMTYLVSHPIFSGWISFADRNRNRSLILLMGIVIFPGMLAGSFTGNTIANERNSFVALLWSLVIIPSLGFWFLFSPEPVFTVTSPSGGLTGLTPLALGLVLTIGVTMLVALVKYAYDWIKTRDRVIMVSTVALGFWLYGEIILVLLESPFQFAEIIWLGAFGIGFLLLAFSMLFSAVLEPQRNLEETVSQRTRELSQSKAESEFYLAMWAHKMGNFLQALLIYLDMMGTPSLATGDLKEIRFCAKTLSREATLLNLQVTNLSQILDSKDNMLYATPLAMILSNAMDLVGSLLDPQEFKAYLEVRDNPLLRANEMLSIAILSIVSFVVKTRITEDLSFVIKCDVQSESVILSVQCPGIELTNAIQEYLHQKNVQLSTNIDFDIFVARSIIELFDGQLSYDHNLHEGMNSFYISIPLAK